MSAVKLLHNDHPISLVGQDGSTWIDYLTKTCPSLIGPEAIYNPTPYLVNEHFQTAYAAYYNGTRADKVKYQREVLQLKDDGQVALDWTPPFADKPLDTTPTVVCLHGLTGGSHEAYIRSVLKVLTRAPFNYRAVVMNARGCSDIELTTPQIFNASDTTDIRGTVEHVRRVLGKETPLLAIGFSLGGNVLVKYLGEEGDGAPFRAAISIANPFHMDKSCQSLENSLMGRFVYLPSMATKIKRVFSRHAKRMSQSKLINVDEVLRTYTMRDLDEANTCKVFGYANSKEYYEESSSSRFIDRVRVPLLCLQALDDPMAPATSIPRKEIQANPHVLLATTDTGGHLGWFEHTVRPTRWVVKPVVEFVVAMTNTAVSKPSDQAST